MTLALRTNFLKDLLLKHLRESESFPAKLPKCGSPIQIVHFSSYREKGESQKSITGIISDQFTKITCQFSAECCNDWEAQTNRRLTEMKGGLFYLEKWELRVVLSHNHDKLRAIAHIDRLEYFGNEGEAMIGDPRDFISYGAVEETLNDPTRQAIYLGHQEEGYQSQQTTPTIQRTIPGKTPAKRRKIAKDEPQAWKDLKILKYQDYQITTNQQTTLDSEQSWFHPGNVESFPNGVENVEVMVPVEEAVNGGHPPLSSPSEEEDISKEQSQFVTQVPPMMDESQMRQLQDRKEVSAAAEAPQVPVEPEEPEPSSEIQYEWEASPDRPKKVLRKTTPPPDLESSDDELPLSQARYNRRLQTPPIVIQNDPPSSPPESALRQMEELQTRIEDVLNEELVPSMKVSTAELLTQPLVEATLVKETIEVAEVILEDIAEEGDLPEEAVEPEGVETKETVTVEIIESKENKVAEVEEQVEQKKEQIVSELENAAGAVEEEQIQEDNPEEVTVESTQEPPADKEVIEEESGEAMQEVEEIGREEASASETEKAEVVVEEVVRESFETIEVEESIEKPKPEETPIVEGKEPGDVAQHTIAESQPVLSTTQDESTTSVYPNSTASNNTTSQEVTTTQDESQQQLAEQSAAQRETPIQETPEMPPPIQPVTLPPRPPYLLPHQMSPPKSTPFPTPSAIVQVQETPFPKQQLFKQMPPPSSTTRINATAPPAISPAKRPAEEMRRKHKRDRHVGPLVPKFSRREQKKTYDLIAILASDRKRFFRQYEKRVSVRAMEEEGEEMEEVIRASPEMEVEKPQEPQPTILSEPEPEPQAKAVPREKAFKSSQQSKARQAPIPPPPAPHPAQQLESTQDTETYDPSTSRWGRLAAHWRRFSSRFSADS